MPLFYPLKIKEMKEVEDNDRLFILDNHKVINLFCAAPGSATASNVTPWGSNAGGGIHTEQEAGA